MIQAIDTLTSGKNKRTVKVKALDLRRDLRFAKEVAGEGRRFRFGIWRLKNSSNLESDPRAREAAKEVSRVA